MTRAVLVCIALLLLSAGCERKPAPQFVSSSAVLDLPANLQVDLRSQLQKHVGGYSQPRLLGSDETPLARLRHGQAVYQEQCAQCHGDSGDGNGPTAKQMYPRPRDYRRGVFKFTSTPYGAKPVREDLTRTIRAGIRGTSMPSFKLLSQKDLEPLIDYVLVLTHRGELEEQLVFQADSEGTIEESAVTGDLIPTVLGKWKEAVAKQVYPLTPQPEFTAEHVRAGKQAFLTKGCAKCHGEDGRGQMPENLGTDVWGFETRAADLTSGMLHGGQEPLDIYRRIASGINGTPMPGFVATFQSEPETMWNLVAYVLWVSNRRRMGEMPPPGNAKPYITKKAASSGEAAPAGS